jgi:uncharacterized protein YjbI with pentapeptide repeats
MDFAMNAVDAETQALKTRLRSRWQGPDGEAMAARVATALRAGQPWAAHVASLPDVDEVSNGQDLRGAPLGGAALDRADLRATALDFVDLGAATLRGADLRGAELSRADLAGSNVQGANLAGARLTLANLARGDFSDANLAGVLLTGADLRGANFTNAILRGAVLLGAKTDGAIFEGAVMDGVRGGQFAGPAD